MPLMSGMRMSVTMQPMLTSAKRSRNAVAEACVSARMPDDVSRKASESRTASSSSMIWTMASAGIGSLLFADGAEREAEDRSAARVRFDPDSTAMGVDDRPRDRQADAHSLPLGGDEGLEQLAGNLGCDPRSSIGDAHLDHVVVDEAGADQEFPRRRIGHGIDGIADQIEKDLLDLDAVGEHEIGVRVELQTYP